MWQPNCASPLEQVVFYVSTAIITSQYINIRIYNQKFMYPWQTAVPGAPSSILAS